MKVQLIVTADRADRLTLGEICIFADYADRIEIGAHRQPKADVRYDGTIRQLSVEKSE